MGKLVHFRADGTAQDIKLDRERITLGRRPDNDVCIAQPAVSGEHAAVVTILADSFLEDLGSTNGTLVNGTPITKHFLRDHDEIDIGRQILVYVVDDSARPNAPPKRLYRTGNHQGDEGDATAESPATAALPVAPGIPRDKRRTDGPTVARGRLVDEMQRAVTTEIESSAELARPTITNEPAPASSNSPAHPPVARSPAIKVLSGANAGRSVMLTKQETLIGRAGVQVVALRRDAEDVRLVPVEGAVPPHVNGIPVAPEGQRLAAGDLLDVAGERLEFVGVLGAGG